MGLKHTASETDEIVIKLLDLVQTLDAELRPQQVRSGSIGLDDSLQRDIGIDIPH